MAIAHEIFELGGSEAAAHRSWRSWLTSVVNQAVSSGDSSPSPDILDALQTASDQVISEALDRRARDLAQAASIEELTAIRDFLKSPAGRVWTGSWASPETKAFEETNDQRVLRLARDQLCAKVTCGVGP